MQRVNLMGVLWSFLCGPACPNCDSRPHHDPPNPCAWESTGYLMERKKKGSQRWMKINFEVFTDTTYESSTLLEGVLFEMRVFAVNAIWFSQPSMNTKPFMPIGMMDSVPTCSPHPFCPTFISNPMPGL